MKKLNNVLIPVVITGELKVGTLVYDHPIRGDIPRYEEAIFGSVKAALTMFPDLTDPLKWLWNAKEQRVQSFEAVDYLNDIANSLRNNCPGLTPGNTSCRWPLCVHECTKHIPHAD